MKRHGGLVGNMPELWTLLGHSILGHPDHMLKKRHEWSIYWWCSGCGGYVIRPEGYDIHTKDSKNA